ncbi:hypothetical protein CLOP_g23485 [Closterium sp. NIES-67]|nr:hypothetical protein CLOP_g23485 [Closterium sp. NIES-67]
MQTLTVATIGGLRLPAKPNASATPPHALASSLTLVPVTRRLIAAPPRAPRLGVKLGGLSAFQPGASRAAVGRTTDQRNAGSKRSGDGAASRGGRVHDVIMADVSEEAKSRLQNLSSFPAIAEKQQGRDAGSYPRRIRGKRTKSAEMAQVEGDWPLSWCHVADGVLIGSPLASADDAKAVLEAADVTAVVSLVTEQQERELGVDWAAVSAAVTDAGGVAVRVASVEAFGEKAAAAAAAAGAKSGEKGAAADSQVPVLLESIRVVASLAASGHRVLVVSCQPNAASALAAIGYLSLVKGESPEAAAAALRRVCPSARPALEALEQTQTHLAAGNSQRLTKLAAAELQQRIAKGVRGSSAGDWKAAERKLAIEGFQRMVAADVALSEALSKAAIRRATREAEKQIEGGAASPQEKVNLLMAQIQQLESRQKAAAEAETAATDRISFFLNQLSTLRTKHAEAEKTAKAASARASRLATQLSAAANREAWSQASAEAAQGRIGELEAEVAGLREREEGLIEARKKAEAEAEEARKQAEVLKAEVVTVGEKQEEAVAAMAEAKERIGFLSGVVKELEQREKAARSEVASAVEMTQVVERREQAALVKVGDLTTRVAALETEVAAAHEAARIANGKCEFFARVMETLREREQAALAQARKANMLLAGVKAELSAAKEREASLRASWKEAVARAEMVVAELGAAKRMQGEAVREREAAEVALAAADSPLMAKAALQAAINNEAYLTALVSTLTARLSDATAERATAGERMRFLERQLAEGKEREQEARERVRVAEREKEGLVVQVERVRKSEEEARREVGVLMQKLDSVAAQSKAAEQVEGAILIMRAQVDVLQAELAAAKQTAEAASERSSFLLRQMDLIKSRQQQKLDAAVAQAVSAEQKKAGVAASAAAATAAAAAAPAASNAEAIMEAAVEKLQKQLAEARAEAEAAVANVSNLEARVGQLQTKEKEAKVLLGRADEKISDLFVQLSAAREKEKVEAKALMKARVELGELSGKVTRLEVELKEKEAAVGGVGSGVGAAATKMVVDLSKGAKELHTRLQDQVARLGQGLTAKPAAPAALDKEEEEIIAAAANLREAVEALNTPAGTTTPNGSATDSSSSSSLRSFDDAVVFDSNAPEAVPVPAKYRNGN